MVEENVENPVVTDPPAWNAGVAEEYQSAISGFADTAGLAKGYSELFTKMGDSTKIPTAESSAEEVNAFYKKLGRPDTSEGYTKPTLAEGEELDNEFFNKMCVIAHKRGASDELFVDLANSYIEYAKYRETQQKEAEDVEFNRYKEESDRKLHETYGADYDKNIELSKRAYTEYAGDELKELLATDKFIGLRNEPSFIDMMVQIGKKNMDDTFVAGDGQPKEPVDNYEPKSPKSPEMYATMDGEEGVKARAYFRNKGHVYERKD